MAHANLPALIPDILQTERIERREENFDSERTYCGEEYDVADEDLGRLWPIYLRAKDEYLNCNEIDSRKIEKAKFLRDTAENMIMDFRNRGISETTIQEAEKMLSQAQITVVSLTGGRKRKFDFTQNRAPRWCPIAPSSYRNDRQWNGRENRDYGQYREVHDEAGGTNTRQQLMTNVDSRPTMTLSRNQYIAAKFALMTGLIQLTPGAEILVGLTATTEPVSLKDIVDKSQLVLRQN